MLLCSFSVCMCGGDLAVPFLQVLELAERPGSSENLEYDPEWLAILKATDGLQNVSPSIWLPPEDNGLHAKLVADTLQIICGDFSF